MTSPSMTRPVPWAQLDCSNQGAATIYVTRRVRPREVQLLRELCEALPSAIRLLKLELCPTDAEQGVLEAIGKALRPWRRLRGAALHFVFVPSARPVPAVPPNERRASLPCRLEHVVHDSAGQLAQTAAFL